MTWFDYIRRAVRAEPSLRECIVRTFLAVAVPTLMRWAIDRGASGSPFVLYFPAIQMITTFLGWRWGAATALGSGVAGTMILMHPGCVPPSTLPEFVVLVLFALSAGTMVFVGQLLRSSILENAKRARQIEDFNSELQHRTKNALQMVRALASQAAKATDPAEFYEKLAGRLGALAKANELLRFGARKSCDIDEIVKGAMAPFGGEQIRAGGPPCQVAGNACTPLMMALHELGTNAHKYGALSRPGGRIDLRWHIVGNREVELVWTESGGPPVSPPTHRGLGSRLMTAQGGMPKVMVEYRPEGVVCTIRALLDPRDES
ncbi:MAG: sensor histidine kinase [Novosphingobium sp.]